MLVFCKRFVLSRKFGKAGDLVETGNGYADGARKFLRSVEEEVLGDVLTLGVAGCWIGLLVGYNNFLRYDVLGLCRGCFLEDVDHPLWCYNVFLAELQHSVDRREKEKVT